MIQVRRYSSQDAREWDAFVRNSRNGTFLFLRQFMDYHSDRFEDYSLICADEHHTLAILPANRVGDVLYSHQGLTYGGMVLAPKTTAGEVMALLDNIQVFLRREGFRQWYYKQVPYIYHRQPSEDDEYALWRIGATLEVCNLATAIDLRSSLQIPLEERRGRGLRRAAKLGYAVRPLSDSAELTAYWPIIEDNLRTCHDTRPVHSCQEMQLLMNRFPEQIRCWVADDKEGVPAGIFVVFEDGPVAHSQYPHGTAEGKTNGVMDLLILHVLAHYRSAENIRYFDFGISNENGGRFLNEGLQAQKEGFGARGVTYRQWRIDL